MKARIRYFIIKRRKIKVLEQNIKDEIAVRMRKSRLLNIHNDQKSILNDSSKVLSE